MAKGFFKPKFPKKYWGNPKTIIWRSSYELKAMRYCDEHSEIIGWNSEETRISYISPVDNKKHTYFPDLLIKKNSGEIILIEIKPKIKLSPPKLKEGKKPKNSEIKLIMEYAVNQAKFEAATEYCKEHGWKFQILTETELGIDNRKRSSLPRQL